MNFTVIDGIAASPDAIRRWAKGYSAIEEFWNDCHNRSDGRFCSKGSAGGRIVAPGHAEQLLRTIKKEGGATLDYENNMAPIRSGFAVAVRPANAAVFELNKVGRTEIQKWLDVNHKLLSKPHLHVGAWHDKVTNKVWLDITRVYPNTSHGRSLAMRAAGRHKQIAIFHLDALQEIEKRNAAALRAGDKPNPPVLTAATEAFACHEKSCAPPPAGHGGSTPGGGKHSEAIRALQDELRESEEYLKRDDIDYEDRRLYMEQNIRKRFKIKELQAQQSVVASADGDNEFEQSGVHHTSCGRWPHQDTEFYSPTQPRARDGKWSSYGSGSVTPSSVASAGRTAYMGHAAADYSAVKAPTGLRTRASHLYEKMPVDDPKVHGAWSSLRDEVRQQHDYMTKTLGVRVEVVHEDPYPTVKELVHDIETNHRIKVWSTASTGAHPLFTNEENDMFRAVHDFFGHAATGRDFGRHGERATYLAHAATMRNKDSVRALFTETEMQNAYLTVRGQGFGPQKIGLAPDTLVFDGVGSMTASSEPTDRVTLSAQVTRAGQVMPVSLSLDALVMFGRARRRSAAAQAKRRQSPASVGGQRDPSLRWPWLYDLLREKGYDKQKAAMISNSRVRTRKKGRLNVLNYKQADNMGNMRRAMHKP